jgi:hypothetical protein
MKLYFSERGGLVFLSFCTTPEVYHLLGTRGKSFVELQATDNWSLKVISTRELEILTN